MLKKIFLKKYFSSTIKSIYSNKNTKLAEEIKSEVYDILEYGYPESKYLRIPCEGSIKSVNSGKIKGMIDSLKKTAADKNVYSLSAPQVKSLLKIFCIHKDLSHYNWFNTDKSKKLDPRDYKIYIEPQIISASNINHYEYEECISFKMLKVKARRPLAIKVKYIDEEGHTQTNSLYDFEARIFCHEFDHLCGIPFIHWRVSEGDIFIRKEYDVNSAFDNLKYTIEYYKNRLRDEKLSRPNLFEYFHPTLINTDAEDIETKLEVAYEFRNPNNLSFQDIMLIDIEKGIRKDLKLKLKKETQNVLTKNNRDENNNIY